MKIEKRKLGLWIPMIGAFILLISAFCGIWQSEPGHHQAMTVKGKDAYKTVLFAGVDEAGENTDMMMLCSLNKENGRIQIMQIPRDTYFETREGGGKINRLFRSCLIKNGKKDAAEKLTAMMSQALGTKIDGYVIFNGETVVRLVDILGGVSVNVPVAFTFYDDEAKTEKRVAEGRQSLHGKEALAFVRHRKSYAEGDLGRLDAQMRFLSGLMRELPNVKKISNLVTIYQEILPNLLTNLKEKDIIEVMMTCFKNRGDLSVGLMRLPGEACYADGHSYYVLYRAATERMLTENFGAVPPFDSLRRFTSQTKEVIGNIYTHNDSSYRIYTPREADEKKVIGR